MADVGADLAVLRERYLGEVASVLVPWGGGWHAGLGLKVAARIAAATAAPVDLLMVVRPSVDAAREDASVRSDAEAIIGSPGAAVECWCARARTPLARSWRPPSRVGTTWW